jgi:hypothetical protein
MHWCRGIDLKFISCALNRIIGKIIERRYRLIDLRYEYCIFCNSPLLHTYKLINYFSTI